MNEVLIENTKKIWAEGDRKKLHNYLLENRMSFWGKDNDLATLLNFSYDLEGNSTGGILFSGKDLKESLKNIRRLRMLLQRLDWCDECSRNEVLQLVMELGSAPEDLYYMAKASSIRPEYLLQKINGTIEPSEDKPQRDYYNPNIVKKTDITFIICSNNEMELEETEYYIKRLYVPDECSVDILVVNDAKSMCAGYNEAMKASKSEYKIYMHHDVRILDKYFLFYLLNIFAYDENIGMIGMVGTREFAEDGLVWHGQLYGSWIEGKVDSATMYSCYETNELHDVLLADGLLLATRHDILWREDLFDSWHFYDASQCMEFKKAGYKVVIPYQQQAWCLHECGWSDITEYRKYSDIFRNEYFC